MSLRSMSQEPPEAYMSNAVGSNRELNPSSRNSKLRGTAKLCRLHLFTFNIILSSNTNA